jgi:uncharacterized protein
VCGCSAPAPAMMLSSQSGAFLWRASFRSKRRTSSSAWSELGFSLVRKTPNDRERWVGVGSARRHRSQTSSPNSGTDLAVICFDSSALVKLVVEEVGSEVAAQLWDEADVVIASRLASPEVHAALATAQRTARLDPSSGARAHRDWDEFWSATRVVELTTEVAEAAATLARKFIVSGADAVHLASAMTMVEANPILVAWDVRLRTAALEAGLAVAPSRV